MLVWARGELEYAACRAEDQATRVVTRAFLFSYAQGFVEPARGDPLTSHAGNLEDSDLKTTIFHLMIIAYLKLYVTCAFCGHTVI